jgi:ferredoxin-thioredoxin reductase catalytic chain
LEPLRLLPLPLPRHEGSREADAKVICPCAPSWKDVEERGHCFCALYLDPAFAAAGKKPSSIPDSRSQF